MTPLQRARAAGYELGPVWEHPSGKEASQAWAGPVPSTAWIIHYFDNVTTLECVDKVTHERVTHSRAGDHRGEYRRRAEEWLGVRLPEVSAPDKEQAGENLAFWLDMKRERDRLAVEVERMRAGVALAINYADPMDLDDELTQQAMGAIRRRLQSILNPTPEAPDDR